MAALAALVLAAILYGSLYPFRLEPPPPGFVPADALREAWARRPGGRGDLLANVALYAPFGLFLAAALPARLGAPGRLLLAALVGALVSGVVEAAQLFVPGRVASGSDLLLNAAGAALGGAAAVAAPRTLGRLRAGLAGPLRPAEPFAALLLLCWLGARLYPYTPALDLGSWWANVKPLLLGPPVLEPARSARLAVSWLLAAELAAAVAGPRLAPLAVPALLAGALAAEVVVVDHGPSLAEVVGIGLAFPLWLLLRLPPRRQAAGALLALLLAAVLAERLAPFRFDAAPRPFGWIPFRSVFGGDWGPGLRALLEKSFLYGGLLWLGVRAGLALRAAAAAVAALLLACGAAQTFLPGRSGEVTDAALALVAALVLRLLEPARPPRAVRERPPGTPARARRRAGAGHDAHRPP